MKRQIILTCEHASNRIPKAFSALFEGKQELLDSHLAYDIGALQLFNALKDRLKVKGIKAEWSRLLIDLNRSLGQADSFSDVTGALDRKTRDAIVVDYFEPYRHQVEAMIGSAIDLKKSVLHISVHSFTPELNGEVRSTDIGLLFDPDRESEAMVCQDLKDALNSANKNWVVDFNKPYKGISDGFVTHLRRMYPNQKYAGIELEVNQKYLLSDEGRVEVVKQISDALAPVLLP